MKAEMRTPKTAGAGYPTELTLPQGGNRPVEVTQSDSQGHLGSDGLGQTVESGAPPYYPGILSKIASSPTTKYVQGVMAALSLLLAVNLTNLPGGSAVAQAADSAVAQAAEKQQVLQQYAPRQQTLQLQSTARGTFGLLKKAMSGDPNLLLSIIAPDTSNEDMKDMMAAYKEYQEAVEKSSDTTLSPKELKKAEKETAKLHKKLTSEVKDFKEDFKDRILNKWTFGRIMDGGENDIYMTIETSNRGSKMTFIRDGDRWYLSDFTKTSWVKGTAGKGFGLATDIINGASAGVKKGVEALKTEKGEEETPKMQQ